ncbi:MAG: GNAT family N-acetyltransferase [Candidatus Bipolaricaulaceae bacterium]
MLGGLQLGDRRGGRAVHPRGANIVGVGQVLAAPDRCTAEFAVLVADPWQGRGLGKELTEVCLAIARRWGVGRVITELAPSNVRMINLLRKLGFHFLRDRRGQIVLGELACGGEDPGGGNARRRPPQARKEDG